MPLARVLLALVLAWNASAADEFAVDVVVEPGKSGRWQVEYRLSEDVDALVFARGSGDYRDGTWRLPRGYIIERLGATDRIRRKNGKPFDRFKATVDTFSERIPKDYTPYIRFTDGSLAMFSGQFIVGVPQSGRDDDFIDGANNDNTRWAHSDSLTVDPGIFETMIVGARVVSDAQTIELGEGEYIYFGDAAALETPYLTSVMDAAAPAWLRDLLYESMAKTFEFYESKLGPLAGGKPFMLTSFTPLEGRRISFSGGVIGSQIAIQLALGDGIIDKPEEREFMAQFFAHESAHLWNNGQAIVADSSEAWLHEGSAEAMAWLALAELGIHTEATATALFEDAANKCIEQLGAGPLETAGRRGQFQAYYECGAAIALATHGAAGRTGGDLFTVWRPLIENSLAAAGSYGADEYFALTDTVSSDLTAAIRVLTESEVSDPKAAVLDLLETGNVAVIDAGENGLALTGLP